MNILLSKRQDIKLSENEFIQLSKSTHGYSYCDITLLCRQAKMISNRQIMNKIKNENIQPRTLWINGNKIIDYGIKSQLNINHFKQALKKVKSNSHYIQTFEKSHYINKQS